MCFKMEYLMYILLAVLCIYATYTDLVCGLIKNKMLICFGGIGVVLDLFCYGILEPEWRNTFILNIGLMITVSVILYLTHIWAAGDSKLLITIATLVPAKLTVLEDRNYYSVLIVAYAFVVSFAYLIGDTLFLLIYQKRNISMDAVKKHFLAGVQMFFVNSIYLFLLLHLEDMILERFAFSLGQWKPIINICILILWSSFNKVYNHLLVAFAFGISVLICVFSKTIHFQLQQGLYYLAIIAFILFRIVINEFNYEFVKTQEVQRGMILSAVSSLCIAASGIKDSPAVSTEDMRSRLTQKQVEAIRAWGGSCKGKEYVQIVRKIPFAIFLSLGVLGYIVVRIFAS